MKGKMRNYRKDNGQLADIHWFAIPLYVCLLLGVCIGFGYSIEIASECSAQPEANRQIVFAFWRAIRFHLPIVVLHWFSVGVLGIPLILFVRGVILGSSVSVLMSAVKVNELQLLLQCLIPAFLQLSGLIYLSAVSFYLCLYRFVGLRDSKYYPVGKLHGAIFVSLFLIGVQLVIEYVFSSLVL